MGNSVTINRENLLNPENDPEFEVDQIKYSSLESKPTKRCVRLFFKNVELGVVTEVSDTICPSTELDVSEFLRGNVRPEFFEVLSAKMVVTIYVSLEESGVNLDPSVSGREALSRYVERLKSEVTDRDVVLVARMLQGKLFEPSGGESIRLDSIMLPYGFIY